MSTLPGLTSRCTTPAACAAASPSATCAPDLRDHARLERTLLGDHRGQRLARQVLHDQPRPVLVHHDVEHADHVRVLQAGPDPPLPHEPLARLLQRVPARRGGRLGRAQQLLDGHGPVQQLVRTAPDDTHRTRRRSAGRAGTGYRSGGHRPQARSSWFRISSAPLTTCRRGRSVGAGFTTSLPRTWRSAVVHRPRGAGLIPRSRSEDAGVGGATKRPPEQVENRGHDADRGHPRRQGRRGAHGTAVDHGGGSCQATHRCRGRRTGRVRR